MQLLALFVVCLFALAIAAGMTLASILFGPKEVNPVKQAPFECGMPPAKEPVKYPSVNFYITAVLFILFDIEIVFLYPWAVNFKTLPPEAFYSMIIFTLVLALALFYAIKREALKWD